MKMSKRRQERVEREHRCHDQRRRAVQDELYRSASSALRLWQIR